MSGGKDDELRKLTRERSTVIGSSDHEEADSRIVLHAVLAAECGATSIVVNSPDTDVLLLLLYHRQNISAQQIYFYNGKRFLPVHTMSTLLTKQQKSIRL